MGVQQSCGSPIAVLFVGGRIIDLSQVAAHELDFDDLTKACLKILSIPEDQPIKEK
jgi:rare lipoprotein A (peptidoglycan hydrolase)